MFEVTYHAMGSLCTAVTLDEARERTSVSWMHNPCSGHVDTQQKIVFLFQEKKNLFQELFS
jgi:hypothetical protein